MSELNGAVVLLTGAAGGFGKELTVQLMAAGSRLILSDQGEQVATLMAAYEQTPAVVGIFAADLGRTDECDGLYEAVRDLGTSPDILINNAGVAFYGRPDHVPGSRIDQLMRINLQAPMRLSQLFLPHMIQRGHGHIVNISSVAGWIGSAGLSAYSASKFGLRGFGESLAVDLEEHGIRVSTVYPWFSRTPILDSDQFGDEEVRKIPDDWVTEPGDVVEKMLRGIRADKREIYPDAMSRRVHLMKRYFPWLIPAMQKRMERKLRS
ncbi:MAG: SDR family NAD(P)-dependent oxidoreductase [Gammaproteobacteria bacterium]|nr:SDR family NAD(P)-dependent oxidoreductase [Gammaproteobacteria bacterium]